MKKKDMGDAVVKVTANFMVPLIMIFAIYVQMHGEITPGGGFQAGVILASAVILYTLGFGSEKFLKIISIRKLQVFSALGVAIYGTTGIVAMLKDGAFLDYSKIFPRHYIFSQEFGVFAVEFGVGLAVFSVMLVLYFTFLGLQQKE